MANNIITLFLQKHHVNLFVQSFQSVSSRVSRIFSADEDSSLRIESMISLRVLCTILKLYKINSE